MRLVILDSANHVGEWAAKYVLKRIRDFNPGPNKYLFSILKKLYGFYINLLKIGDSFFVLGLPTGSTPLGKCFFNISKKLYYFTTLIN